MDDLDTFTIVKLPPGVTAFGAAPMDEAKFNNRRVHKPTTTAERSNEYWGTRFFIEDEIPDEVIQPKPKAQPKSEERKQKWSAYQNDYWKRLRKSDGLSAEEEERIRTRREKMKAYQSAYRQRLKQVNLKTTG